MSEPEKEAAAEGEAKPKGKKKLIIIIAVVVLLAIVGGSIAFLGGKKEGEEGGEHEAESHEEVAQLATAELENFIVNLSDSASFLKVKILLEYDPALFEEAHGSGGEAAENALPAKLTERMPMIRDAVIRSLSAKKSTEVLTAEGKETLKEELLESINEAIGLEESPVVNIYFTEFIVQ